ncbi:MAG: CPCC family cysteine-rich protein [Gammaproteobacteria bacterium]
MFDRFPCPCCGYLVFRHQPGSHSVCPICRWEDDLGQLRFPNMPGGANTESLARSQRNFNDFGAASKRTWEQSREPNELDDRDPQWRPMDGDRDNPEEPSRGVDYMDSYPVEDTTVLYYWRDTYWRRYSS